MREILFRGKRVDNGEWAYGDLLHCDDEAEIYSESVGKNGGYVIPETVGRYTGLTDKNGTRIFEGDVVKYERHIHLVTYYNEYAGFYPFYDQDNPIGYGVIGEESEVIGNIYDNPELLKGE